MNDWAASSLFRPGLSSAREVDLREIKTIRPAPKTWDPEAFAREQIRGLVQQVFFSNADKPIHHVVFTSMEEETNIRGICHSVGQELARQNVGSVALVASFPRVCPNEEHDQPPSENGSSLRENAALAGPNLWLVPQIPSDSGISAASMRSRSADLRREFDFSLVVSSRVGDPQSIGTMAQLADGVILVVSARYTRRASAIRVKRALECAQARVLGVVLSDRMFPIPEKMYQRL